MAAPKPIPDETTDTTGNLVTTSGDVKATAGKSDGSSIPGWLNVAGKVLGPVIPGLGAAADVTGNVGDAVSETVSVGKAIGAFIANPVRVVEALVGLLLIGVGMSAALKSQGVGQTVYKGGKSAVGVGKLAAKAAAA